MIKHKFHLSFLTTKLGHGIQFGEISLKFKDIELNPISGKDYELIIGLENNKSIEESIKDADLKANDLVDRLALLDSHEITNLIYIGSSIGDAMSVNLTGSSSLDAIPTTLIQDPLSFYSLDNNIVVFNSNSNACAKRVYRYSQRIRDDISKYLIYYGLLQILVSEEQEELEKYIKTELPTISILKRNRTFIRKNNQRKVEVEETVITRVRNLIAHPNDELDIEKLMPDVKANIESLRRMVVNILRNE